MEAAASAPPSTPPSIPAAAPAPKGLPVIAYLKRLPSGLPADPTPMASELPTEILRPTRDLVVYDAPGGRPRAILPKAVSGIGAAVPIVARESGWVAALMPSGNRTMGWLPPAGWITATTADQVVIHRKAHRLTWYRDGQERGSWKVSVGSKVSPTPLGRSFVFGRSKLPGEVYGGLDVLALGSVPDDPDSVPVGLRGAHIGIHSWYQNTFGGDTSDGCVQVPQPGQRLLLENLRPGAGVLVLP
ncbi:hypothetical protein GCM10010201_01970 [Pilimelia columellifera subsp. columellifera]|uniref:L,D-TPase catalytic domain-containing protein n=1 Tax=Pilimelia columellifera subsp. columellifera TaxID=706583 RepID=A0ABP6A523_9ACTN